VEERGGETYLGGCEDLSCGGVVGRRELELFSCWIVLLEGNDGILFSVVALFTTAETQLESVMQAFTSSVSCSHVLFKVFRL